MKTYYDVLGISSNATKDDIKSAFRKRAKEVHPDVAQGRSSAKEDFILLREAYEVLSDSQKRDEYDRWINRKPKKKSQGSSKEPNSPGGYARADVSEDQRKAYKREWEDFKKDYRGYFNGMQAGWKEVAAGLLAGLLMTGFNIVFCTVVIGLVIGIVGGLASAFATTGWGLIGSLLLFSYSYIKLKEIGEGNWPYFAKSYANHISGLFYILMSSGSILSKKVVANGVFFSSATITVALAGGIGYWALALFSAFEQDMQNLGMMGGIMVFFGLIALLVAFVAIAIWVVMSVKYTTYLCKTVKNRMPEIKSSERISKL